MDSKSLKLIFFSPTQTTASIVNSIAQGIASERVSCLDLTFPNAIEQAVRLSSDVLTLIGAPVYGGRIPEEAVRRLQLIQGNNTPAVIVVVYGNRAYEDALLELRDIAVAQGFKPIAAAAFIGEHSFDCEFTNIASGRPDLTDSEKAKQFGLSIHKKMSQLDVLGHRALPVPGNFPYKARSSFANMVPVTDHALCILCGDCIELCPTGAITVADSVSTDQDLCIHCSACVKHCITGARKWENPVIDQIRERLSANCQQRKEPEIFL